MLIFPFGLGKGTFLLHGLGHFLAVGTYSSSFGLLGAGIAGTVRGTERAYLKRESELLGAFEYTKLSHLRIGLLGRLFPRKFNGKGYTFRTCAQF